MQRMRMRGTSYEQYECVHILLRVHDLYDLYVCDKDITADVVGKYELLI